MSLRNRITEFLPGFEFYIQVNWIYGDLCNRSTHTIEFPSDDADCGSVSLNGRYRIRADFLITRLAHLQCRRQVDPQLIALQKRPDQIGLNCTLLKREVS